MTKLPKEPRLARRRILMAAVVAAIGSTVVVLARPSAAAELVMFEEPGCAWCAAWREEIGVVYDKTDEGRRAPLRRVDKAVERPSDLAAIQGVLFSPTFVLLDEGIEIGRIVGYPGEHFFWPMLQELLARLDGGRGG